MPERCSSGDCPRGDEVTPWLGDSIVVQEAKWRWGLFRLPFHGPVPPRPSTAHHDAVRQVHRPQANWRKELWFCDCVHIGPEILLGLPTCGDDQLTAQPARLIRGKEQSYARNVIRPAEPTEGG